MNRTRAADDVLLLLDRVAVLAGLPTLFLIALIRHGAFNFPHLRFWTFVVIVGRLATLNRNTRLLGGGNLFVASIALSWLTAFAVASATGWAEFLTAFSKTRTIWMAILRWEASASSATSRETR